MQFTSNYAISLAKKIFEVYRAKMWLTGMDEDRARGWEN
jgi:hypothetical protein